MNRLPSFLSKRALATTATQQLGRLQVAAEPLIHYSKVSLEFLKLVSKHQSLTSPGSFTEAQQGYSNFIAAFRNGAWRKVTVENAGQLALAGTQVVGFFVVGEMIGRQSIIGYKVPTGDDHHH